MAPITRISCSLLAAAAATCVIQADGGPGTPFPDPVKLHFAPNPNQADGREETFTAQLVGSAGGLRHYRLTTTQFQRDDTPQERLVAERPELPRLRSGNLAFDALFAMALDDMRLDSVSEIRDSTYNRGEAIARDVFQTGEKWTYVWTRDVSYAIDLGLGAIDPRRSAETLLFKVSPFREGLAPPPGIPEGSRQIIQDTGSGGSWPVSTDRVSWAWAAESLLDQLEGRTRQAFFRQAYAALRGTIAADREAAYDPASGLYGGEQSFLDWRTQTYAPWIVDNLAWMSESKALSTNACHHRALLLASRLAEEMGEMQEAARYRFWAARLATAINEHFWIPEAGLYASLTTPGPHPRPEYRFDLLGNALVILGGIAPAERARSVLKHYPHGPMGAPVYFPQQPDVYVYHNRALWPFVTAYGLMAAQEGGHAAAADAAVETLVRGAALNLSNMENFEWLTGLPYYDDGPAINSRRQLWSVAGYLGMVLRTVFGYSPGKDGLRLEPFLTAGLRQQLGDTEQAVLDGIYYRDAALRITLQLPPAGAGTGHYPLQEVRLNGTPVTGAILRDRLNDLGTNEIVLSFSEFRPAADTLTRVDPQDLVSRRDPAIYAPECPVVRVVERSGRRFLEVADPVNEPANIRYQVFRDGLSLGWLERAGLWPEPLVSDFLSHHYSVVAEFRDSGHRSHQSRPLRVDGTGYRFLPASLSSKGAEVNAAGFLPAWGGPEQELVFDNIEIAVPGRYALRLRYFNDAHTIDSGVTCGVKRVRLERAPGEVTVGKGVFQMPNVEVRGDQTRWQESTAWILDLQPGRYSLVLSDYFNMSYLQSNSTYQYVGGLDGPHNRVDLAGLCLIPLPAAD